VGASPLCITAKFGGQAPLRVIFDRAARRRKSRYVGSASNSGGISCAAANDGQCQKAAVSNRSKTVFLLDDLVGGHLHDQRHREAERLRRFEIDDEFELRGLLHRRPVLCRRP
jgi:hypothetical protein